MKQILIALSLLSGCFVAQAIDYHKSLDEIKIENGIYQPWYDYVPGETLATGEIVKCNIPVSWISGNDGRYHPNVSYAVIEYPGEGIYYGFTWDVDSKPSEPAFGYFKDAHTGQITKTIGKTPHQWKAEGVKKPSGKYYFWNKGRARDKSIKGDQIVTATFNVDGTYTMTFGQEYTEYAPQILAGEYSVKYKNRAGQTRKRKKTAISGGFYYDITAKASVSGRWSVKGDSIYLNQTTSPKFSVNTKYNKEALIDSWKEEDARKFFPFELDTSRRQFMAQAAQEYDPNFPSVMDEKKELLDDIKYDIEHEKFIFPKGACKIFGLGKNDLLIHTNNKYLIFQKEYDFSMYCSKNFKEWYTNLLEPQPQNLINARKISIYQQLKENSSVKNIDMVQVMLYGDGSTGHFAEIFKDENGKPYIIETKFKVADGKLIPTSEPINASGGYDNYVMQVSNNETQLKAALENKKDKKAQKLAKEYFKQTKNLPTPETTYNDWPSFISSLRALDKRIKLQKEYLQPE